ncbi:MAG: M23 family metallopeptidase [Anaerolineae bacterium]
MSHNHGVIRLQVSPAQIYVGRYEALPYPNLTPAQEFVFEVAILAAAPVTISDVLFQTYSGSQLLSERRRNGRSLARLIGEEFPVRVVPGEGLALRRCYFWEPGLEKLTQVFITVTARTEDGAEQQAAWGAPLLIYEQTVDLRLPFRDTWWTIMGNDWTDLHKGEPISQPFALDFARLGPDNGTFRGSGLALADHYSFGEPVLAPADGEVVILTADMPDNPPGTPPQLRDLREDPRRSFGNALFIAHNDHEFSFLAHLQAGSISVPTGATVARGQEIARCGNSGLSPGPHLHYHLQNGPNLYVDQGVPVQFGRFRVTGDMVERSAIPTRLIVTPVD